ncbi:MAG TPA: MFS transporter [Solibacterales bacterium]|nr:MFS transporter [Bryobacterales bacterium]
MAAARPVSLSSYWRLLRGNRNLRLLWSAQVVSEIGDWLYSVAIYSLLLDLTGSAKSVALAVVLQVLPQVFIAPMAGAINDRLSRRHVMIAADLFRVGIVGCMVFVRTVEMVPFLYFLLLCETVMWGFFEPGRTAMIPTLTRDEHETAVANALSSTTWSFNLAFGSTLGGVLAVAAGREAVFAINGATFLVSALLLLRMKVVEPHAEHARLRLRDLFDFTPALEGLRYVRGKPRLLATLLVKGGLGLMGAHWIILPILGERSFPVAADQLGAQRAGMLGMSLLLGSRGIGALLGPLIGGYWAGSSQPRLRRAIVFGFAAMAAGYLLLSAAPTAWAAAACVVLAHAGGSVIWVFSTTLLHFQTDDKFRGRVFSADFSCLTGTMALVTWLGGVAVDAGVSVGTVAAVTGAMAIFPALLWMRAQRLWRSECEPGS